MPMILRNNADGSLAIVDVRTGREVEKWTSMDEAEVPGGGMAPYLFDDFLQPTLLTNTWAKPTKGSDGATVDFAFNAGVNGRIQATTGAGAGANMATNGVQIYSALNWKANQGSLFFETRLQISAITTICVFAGFTNQVSSLQMPINSAGAADTFTNNAADAVGWMFDTSMATARWWATGVAGSVGATNLVAANAPVAATYDKLRVELDTTGNATFFLNDIQTGPIASCVTATVALTPTIAIFRRSAAAATCLVDYICVGSART